MKNLFYVFLININISLIISYLKIPFKTFYSENMYSTDKKRVNYIYISMNMGIPKQNLNKIILKQENYPFFLYDNCSYSYKNSQKCKIIQEELTDKSSSNCKKGIYLMDSMHLGENTVDNTSFVFCTKYNMYQTEEYKNFDGEIGLNMGFDDKYDSNFIRQLKANNAISNYFYSIIYENDDEGFLLIGEYPHNIDIINNNIYNKYSTFKKENLNWLHAVKNDKKPRWGITFEKISYSNSELFQIQRECIFSVENKFIFSTFQYFNLIKEIFGKKCKQYQFFHYFDFLECEKDIVKEFTPEIKFYSKDLNMSFTLDYNDLFIEKEDSLLFLVVTYTDMDEGYWILGKPFLKKYLFLFDIDTKMIGFYVNDISKVGNNEINNAKKSSFNLSIFINILLLCILLILIFVFYRYYMNRRRIRANELEDKFNYIAQNDKDIKEFQ